MSHDFQFLIYKSAEEDVSVSAFIQDETIWITANQMAILFDKSESTIRKHINNVFDEGELNRENNTQKVRVDGVKQPVAFYNLDVIISVGYRVNSRRATQFRIWATSVLKEYMLKGFAMDDEGLKQGKTAFGKDYFRELLERVRSIRASERRIWQQITDIFAECSIDYDNAFRDGILKTTGTDVDRLMPPVSRFGGGGSRDKKKQTVIEKLKAFFEKYFGLLNPTEPITESKVVNYQYTTPQSSLGMVAEEPAPYGAIE